MTFKEYCANHDPITQEHPSGSILVLHRPGGTFNGWELHHLQDYTVTSSASGPGYWLVPRK